MTNSEIEYCSIYADWLNSVNAYYLSYDEWYKYRCAHEFGHVMGLWDAYGNNSSNENYQITDNKIEPKEFYSNDLMCDAWAKTGKASVSDTISLNTYVSSNDIEMLLQTYIDNDWQYYYQGWCSFAYREVYQKLSKSIKHPMPSYNDILESKDCYFDRVTNEYIY